jgi:hypothetical protein
LFPGKQSAGVKVQLSFDYLSGTLNALALTPARQPDQRCPFLTACAAPGSLQIVDLGYFDQRTLAELDAGGAYFVTRLQNQTALYHLVSDERLDLAQTLSHCPFSSGEWSVELDAKARLPVRLVAQRLPEAMAEERRRKANAHARRWGKTGSQRQLDLLAWNLWITHVPAACLQKPAPERAFYLPNTCSCWLLSLMPMWRASPLHSAATFSGSSCARTYSHFPSKSKTRRH